MNDYKISNNMQKQNWNILTAVRDILLQVKGTIFRTLCSSKHTAVIINRRLLTCIKNTKPLSFVFQKFTIR